MEADSVAEPEYVPEVRKRLFALAKSLMGDAGIPDSQLPPGPIFHFTTAAGLLGILHTKRMWATNTDYLNDTTEVAFGRRMALEIMHPRYQELNHHVMPANLVTLLKAPGQVVTDTPIELLAPWALLGGLMHSLQTYRERQYYVTSFCESHDLLSQWRGYGNYGGGYAIGMEFTKPSVQLKDDHSYGLLKMLYDETKQRNLLTRFIDGVLDELNSCLPLIGGKENLNRTNPYFATIVGTANELIRLLPLRFKSPGFSEEAEWRFSTGMMNDAVNDVQHVNEVKYRDSKGMITPYLELRIDVPELQIKSIYCGPTLHPELSIHSVSMLLARYGMQGVIVGRSTIPFKL